MCESLEVRERKKCETEIWEVDLFLDLNQEGSNRKRSSEIMKNKCKKERKGNC